MFNFNIDNSLAKFNETAAARYIDTVYSSRITNSFPW